MVISRGMVARIVERGQRVISAASLAVAVVAAGSAYLLLASRLPGLDRLGADLLTFFVGGSLLFAAGSYRNVSARLLLRGGGLASWVVLAGAVVPSWSATEGSWVVLAAVVLGMLCIVVAVASGRGWRSVWWSRRAEVGESMFSALAIAALSLSTGLFSHVWVLTSR
jgi:peptidoglycan/LPS O-acetylase OafA/YrhL